MRNQLRRHVGGFSMIEVLVSILILALGLLGLAGLQQKLLIAEMESYQRAQALVLLQGMVEKLRTVANMQDGSVVIATYTGTVGGGTQAEDCSGAAAGPERDLCEWGNALNGSAETFGAKLVGGGVGAIGCIEAGANPYTYVASVAWQGYSPTFAPKNECGAGAFGEESNRRVASETVVIPNLGCLTSAC